MLNIADGVLRFPHDNGARDDAPVVVISRSVIAAGAHVGDIFRYNTTYLRMAAATKIIAMGQ